MARNGTNGKTASNGQVDHLGAVLTQLKISNRLLAAQLRRPADEPLTQQEVVSLLAGTGASTQDMANVLGTSPNTVRKAQLRLRNSR
jgi:DNA-binding CsgD family transcriptional regulator